MKTGLRSTADCKLTQLLSIPQDYSLQRIYASILNSKAQASVLAVAERQSLETLSRDEKTSARALAQLKNKIEELTNKKTKLAEDDETARTRRTEVGVLPIVITLLVDCLQYLAGRESQGVERATQECED